MFTQLRAIAANTFKENIRDRVLTSILFFAVLVVALSVAAQEITIGDQAKVVRSVALGAIRLFSSIMAMFLGVGLVYKEIERRTIYTIASKPIARWTFLLGKYAGLMSVIAVLVGLMALVYTVVIGVQQGLPHPSVYLAMLLMLVELGLLTAWALLFSSYSSPVTASLFTLAVFVIGHLADDVWRFGQLSESPLTRRVYEVIYWLLPNLSVFDLSGRAVHGLPVAAERFALATAYGLGYTAAVLALASLVFSRRDFR